MQLSSVFRWNLWDKTLKNINNEQIGCAKGCFREQMQISIRKLPQNDPKVVNKIQNYYFWTFQRNFMEFSNFLLI